MTIGLQTQTTTWARENTALAGFVPDAIREFVAGEYIFGVDAAHSSFNLADPSKPATVQGVPTYTAHSATIRSHASAAGKGFKTGIVPDMGCTLVLVRKNAAVASQPAIMGMAMAGLGFGLRQWGTENYMSAGEGLYTQGAHRAGPASAAAVYFEMVTHVPRGYALARYGNAGALTPVISPHASSANSRLNIDGTPFFTEVCVGSDSLSDSINNNSCEVFYAAIINCGFTDSQAAEYYQSVKSRYADLGIAIE